MVTVSDIGKLVRVVGHSDKWNGCIGRLLNPRTEALDNKDGRWPVAFEKNQRCYFFPHHLERTPK